MVARNVRKRMTMTKNTTHWHDDEAAVLAVCLVEGKPGVRELAPEHFRDGFHRELYRVLCGLAPGFTVEQLTATALQDEGMRAYKNAASRIERVRGAYSTGVLLARDVAQVREWAVLRTLERVGAELARAVSDGRKPGELLTEARETLAALDATHSPTRERVGEILAADCEQLAARRKGVERPIATPWPSLNRSIGGGLWPGLVTLTADTGAGKTQAALQLLLAAARAGVPALYVGLELDRLGVTARLLSLAYHAVTRKVVPWSALYLGTGDKATLPEAPETIVETARAELAPLPLHLAWGNPEGWSMSSLAADLAAVTPAPEAGKHRPPVLAVVDFLQLVAPEPEARGDLRETIRTAAYKARSIARERNACIVLVSSTARDNYGKLAGEIEKGGKPPDELKTKWEGRERLNFPEDTAARYLGTGKESGEIEYAADLALVLCRWRFKTEPPPVWCAVAKQRAGKPAWVELAFDGSLVTDPAGAMHGGTDGKRREDDL
jgi:replicative DNA helicase